MPEKIEPALSAEEWAKAKADGIGDTRNWTHDKDGTVTFGVAAAFEPYREDFAGALIALLNNSLPASDPRKITREKLRLIGRRMGLHDDEEKEFLDALESYLPPA